MLLSSLCFFLGSLVAARSVASDLPIVDLGYERHQALSFNSTGRYYNFTNIRYGAPPVGPRRFALPESPTNSSPIVVNGSGGHNCPATFPCWFEVQTEFVKTNLSGEPFDFDAAIKKQNAVEECSNPLSASKQNPQESEDCLFLDVIVPDDIFGQGKGSVNSSARTNSSSSGAAVVVYVFGGGYTGGSKTSSGTPAGLIRNSRENGSEGIIYVGINYRLGTLGFMYGSNFNSSGGLPNAGLYDQRLALQWVQQNIHKFGGDPNRVTVMGESAGGGSIIMQMTAYGTGEPPPFQQAILQSPAWEPGSAGPAKQNEIYDRYLDILNASSLDEVRQLPSKAVIDANHVLMSSIEYGATFLGPVIDSTFIPSDPKRLLLSNATSPSIPLLTTFAQNEGLRFAPPNITTSDDFALWVSSFVNSASPAILAEITTTIYPPIFNGSYPYTTQLERADLFWAEITSICNPRYAHLATPDAVGYMTEFDVKPALHQGDVSYVFWNGPGSDLEVDEEVASVTQTYITNFAMTGDPNGRGAPRVGVYDGMGRGVLDESAEGFREVEDVTRNERCEWWQRALYSD